MEPLNLVLSAIPRKYYQEVGDDGVQAHPIGTGPWKFVSRKVREELIVERFEDYWNRDAMPVAKRLRIKIIPEDTTRVAAFKTRAVDWIDAVPPAQVGEFETSPGVRVVSLPTPNNLFVALNAVDPASPFAFQGPAGGRACGQRGRHRALRSVRPGHPHRAIGTRNVGLRS